MGRNFIKATLKTKNFNADIEKLKRESAFMYGHSYSGTINMLDENREFKEFEFYKLLKKIHIVDKNELEIYNQYEKKDILKINKILTKKDILKEITFKDFVNFMIGKKVIAWKKLILREFNFESDILWYIEYKKNNFVYWGWCRC